MLRTLRGRIGAALVVFALVTLVAVGGAMWVVLRELHREAGLGSLAQLSAPYVTLVRQRLVPGDRGFGFGPGDGRPGPAQRLIDTRQLLRQVQDQIDEAGISVILAREDGAIAVISSDGGVTVHEPGFSPALALPPAGVRTGAARIEGVGEALYAASPIGGGRLDPDISALVLARPDDSAQLATEDLLRALTVTAILLLLIGVPLAGGLSRSVSRPLHRLAEASGEVARGVTPAPLPTDGPSEVADASAAFNAMAAEVVTSREAQRQLLADVRHDLRTPLTVIGGFAEALRDGTATGPAAERAADAIADEAARLGRMLDDLDHLTEPEADLPTMRLESLDGTALAEEAVARFAAQAESQGQAISLAADAQRATVLADPDAVARILGNVVANALAHAPRPGGNVRIEVARIDPGQPPIGGPGGWQGRDGVILAVRDDGPGIPPEALPRVFDRFYRADPARSGNGSGLGLAIVRDLAHAMGGRAFAENPPGGGARVGVVLPRSPGAAT
jgi:signal transduction histidine kinase